MTEECRSRIFRSVGEAAAAVRESEGAEQEIVVCPLTAAEAEKAAERAAADTRMTVAGYQVWLVEMPGSPRPWRIHYFGGDRQPRRTMAARTADDALRRIRTRKPLAAVRRVTESTAGRGKQPGCSIRRQCRADLNATTTTEREKTKEHCRTSETVTLTLMPTDAEQLEGLLEKLIGNKKTQHIAREVRRLLHDLDGTDKTCEGCNAAQATYVARRVAEGGEWEFYYRVLLVVVVCPGDLLVYPANKRFPGILNLDLRDPWESILQPDVFVLKGAGGGAGRERVSLLSLWRL